MAVLSSMTLIFDDAGCPVNARAGGGVLYESDTGEPPVSRKGQTGGVPEQVVRVYFAFS
jgi:hypothetical protein